MSKKRVYQVYRGSDSKDDRQLRAHSRMVAFSLDRRRVEVVPSSPTKLAGTASTEPSQAVWESTLDQELDTSFYADLDEDFYDTAEINDSALVKQAARRYQASVRDSLPFSSAP